MHRRPSKISAPSRLTPEKLEFTQRCVELGCQSGITLHISKCGRSLCVSFLRCLFDCSHVFVQSNRHPVHILSNRDVQA